MHINEVYTSSSGFLKPEDITKPTVVTIAGVELSERDYNDGKGVRKQLVATFEGTDKKWGINFTNAQKIAELIGSDDSDDWVGTSIKLFVEKVKVGNDMKPGIRVWPELPTKTKKAVVEEDEDDSIPF